ncbi:hypothetical protein [Planobispora longispora]|uniref:Uncharacterized protein n=1 Tax=Planobispora longispora TaxID=28887 RepID=A0A8J3RPZ8_9ACTN|nr:hypothetical protein [Planobispora longispora]GIH78096.1 hypothetical protein Plo01_45250 [Planobispora longispora]
MSQPPPLRSALHVCVDDDTGPHIAVTFHPPAAPTVQLIRRYPFAGESRRRQPAPRGLQSTRMGALVAAPGQATSS